MGLAHMQLVWFKAMPLLSKMHMIWCLMLSTVVVIVIGGQDDGVTRQLSAELNPGCANQLNTSQCDTHRLFYVKASASDMLHVLVSLWDEPACLLLRTPLDQQVQLNWTQLVSSDPSGAVVASGVLAAYGLSFQQLIEFDDPEDRADLFEANGTVRYELSTLQLGSGQLEIISNSSSLIQLSLQSPPLNDTDSGINGTVTFKFEILNSYSRSSELPHLQQTGNSVIAGVVLDRLSTNSTFQHSRFGLRMNTIGNEQERFSLTKSLDDEYTPGVFKLVTVDSESPAAVPAGGFLQWRPVVYTNADFNIEHSTTALQYNITSSDSGTLSSRLLRAFFTPANYSRYHLLAVSFGLSEDGWYKGSHYAAWSTTMGVGDPPTDKLSLMVILLLSIGLGLPTVALLGGAVWLGIRRLRAAPYSSRLLIADE